MDNNEEIKVRGLKCVDLIIASCARPVDDVWLAACDAISKKIDSTQRDIVLRGLGPVRAISVSLHDVKIVVGERVWKPLV